MPTVLDLAARVADALKDSEFHNHWNRIRLHTDVPELQRIQFVRYCNCLQGALVHNDLQSFNQREPIFKEDLKQYLLLTALCKKLKVPCKILPEELTSKSG